MRASLPIAAAFLAACSYPGHVPEPAADAASPVTIDAGSIASAPGHVLGQEAYIKASNPTWTGLFGGTVALSADGSTLAVSAGGEDSAATGIDGDQADHSAPRAGAVYVFVRSGAKWSQQAYVKASNTGAEDGFGTVALSADGSTMAVVARGEDSAATGIDGDQGDNSASLAGAVYVFTRTGTTWKQQAYVKASNTGAGDLFGRSIALSADGSTLAVGATHEDSAATGIDGDQGDNSALNAGAVYVFTRTGTTWKQQAYVKASNTGAGDYFGSAVALSGDGSTLAVGAESEDSAATGIDGDQADNSAPDAGAVYVFARSGATWKQQAYVKASSTGRGFGQEVTLSGDGSTLAVGAARSAIVPVVPDTAYVFKLGPTWSQEARVEGNHTERLDGFGYAIALSNDGSILAVGATGESSAASGVGGNQADNSLRGAGAAYLFTLDVVWSQRAYIKASNPGQQSCFGAVSLSADGSILAVGAQGESSASTGINSVPSGYAAYAGAVYVFH